MVSGFICGTSNLRRDGDGDEDEEYERKTRSAGSSPRKSRSKSSSNNNKNPYSTRGLDRFSALLSEIEEKRRKIYSQVLDPNEISLVRFVYTDDHEFKPIVVKSKPKGTDQKPEKQPKNERGKNSGLKKLSSSKSITVVKENEHHHTRNGTTTKNKAKMNFDNRLWVDPRIYLSMVFILTLVILLAFNNKSFAIMCTSIGWYVIPSISVNSKCPLTNSKTSFKKKDYAIRRLSQKKLVSTEGTKSFKHHRERVNGGHKNI